MAALLRSRRGKRRGEFAPCCDRVTHVGGSARQQRPVSRMVAPMLRVRLLSSVLLALALASACEDDHEEGSPTGADCPQDSTLTWDTFGKQFMESYCTRCHSTTITGSARQGAPSDHNFEAVALVREQIEHIDWTAAAGPDAVNTEMPVGAPTPTQDERRQLGEWLACGAP